MKYGKSSVFCMLAASGLVVSQSLVGVQSATAADVEVEELDLVSLRRSFLKAGKEVFSDVWENSGLGSTDVKKNPLIAWLIFSIVAMVFVPVYLNLPECLVGARESEIWKCEDYGVSENAALDKYKSEKEKLDKGELSGSDKKIFYHLAKYYVYKDFGKGLSCGSSFWGTFHLIEEDADKKKFLEFIFSLIKKGYLKVKENASDSYKGMWLNSLTSSKFGYNFELSDITYISKEGFNEAFEYLMQNDLLTNEVKDKIGRGLLSRKEGRIPILSIEGLGSETGGEKVEKLCCSTENNILLNFFSVLDKNKEDLVKTIYWKIMNGNVSDIVDFINSFFGCRKLGTESIKNLFKALRITKHVEVLDSDEVGDEGEKYLFGSYRVSRMDNFAKLCFVWLLVHDIVEARGLRVNRAESLYKDYIDLKNGGKLDVIAVSKPSSGELEGVGKKLTEGAGSLQKENSKLKSSEKDLISREDIPGNGTDEFTKLSNKCKKSLRKISEVSNYFERISIDMLNTIKKYESLSTN